jgi:hypothetical protein
MTEGQRRWLRARDHLGRHRHALAVRAFRDYRWAPPIGDAPLLVRPEWLPDRPVPLRSIRLDQDRGRSYTGLTGTEPPAVDVLPVRPDGRRYERYSDALTDLAPSPALRNLPTYRLLDADLRGAPRLLLGDGHYFDGLDVGEAAAHEYAAAELGELVDLTLRTAVGDPTAFSRRPANVAVSALTLRHERRTGRVTMPLHRRDLVKVGHAGGMFQVLPVGVFQPTGPEPWNVTHDLDLWRLLLREYAEELLGASEDYDTTEKPFNYGAWPFGRRMTAALSEGCISASVLGLGVDPLTFATDLLAVVVLDSVVYDDLFAAAVATNSEGSVLPAVPFTEEQVDRYAGSEPTQAAGAALLRLAWFHRESLLRPVG